MEIELFHFKNYTNFSISIIDGTTLIKGDSGIGKSNIFEAVTWALYGSIREIDPWTNPSAKTKVIIRYKDLIIQRTRRPTSFSITTSEGSFEDPLAKDIIEKYFGSRIIWECTGYLDEDLSNTLFSLTSKQRLNVLNILNFPDNNPEDKIEEINNVISEQRHNYEVARDIHRNFNLEYENWWEKNSENILAIEDEGIPQYTVEELRRTLKQLNGKLLTLKSEEARQGMLENRLAAINRELAQAETILSKETDIPKLEQQLSLTLEREKLEANQYLHLDVDTDKFGEDDYVETIGKELAYDRYQGIIQKYKIKDDQTCFHDEMENLRDIISRANTDFYPLVKRKEELSQKLPTNPPIEPEHNFTWEDVLATREYESVKRHNSRILSKMEKYNLDIPLPRMKEIVQHEGMYVLIRKKLELKKKLELMVQKEPPEHNFTHDDLHSSREIERKRKIIDDNALTEDHFNHMKDIESVDRFSHEVGTIVPPEVTFTETDLDNAKKLYLYRKEYDIHDFEELQEAVSKNRAYTANYDYIRCYFSHGEYLEKEGISEQEMNKIEKLYKQVIHEKDPLKCPHCEQDLYLDVSRYKLEKFDLSISKKEGEEIIAKFEEYRKVVSAISAKKYLEKKHVRFFPPLEEIKEYSSYQPYFHGENFTDTLVNIEYSIFTIGRYLEFKQRYDKLSDYAKRYFDDLNLQKYPDRSRYLIQLSKYYHPPQFSSNYIQECIGQNEAHQIYRKTKAEHDNLNVGDVEMYDGDISVIKEYLSLHNQLKEQRGTEPKYSSIYMEKCIQQEQDYQLYIKTKKEHDSIIIPDQLIISIEELDRHRSKLRDLESVEFTIKPDPSSKYIRNSIEKTKILDELVKYSDLTSSRDIRNQLNRDKDIRRQQDCMSVLKEKLIAEKDDIIIGEAITPKIKQIYDDILSYENEIDTTVMYNDYITRKTRRDDLSSEVQIWISKLSKTEELLRIATDTMYQVLSASITDINVNIEKIVSVIFNDPIEIKLKMFKQLKTKNISKPEVSLEVRYRGGVLNNIKRLSKGEKSRIVLAVTLALNKIFNLPILLLDETLAHIDQNMKENVTTVLKEYAAHRPLVIIAHDIISGIYDNLIEL